MQKNIVILIAEDDEGHAVLIKKNLVRSGIQNEILHFKDGQEILDFLFQKSEASHRLPRTCYVLLLDIRMPKIDGIEVLAQMKADSDLCKVPVIMLSTTDDPKEVARCHTLGCSSYITKPVTYERFTNTIRQLGLFLGVIEVPSIN